MPIREYRCVACGHTQEELTGQTYSKTTKCERCNALSVHKWSIASHYCGFDSGYDIAAGRFFYTKQERDNWLSENNMKEDRGMSGHSRNGKVWIPPKAFSEEMGK